MIEYRSSLKGNKEVQGIIVFYEYKTKIIIGILIGILSILLLVLGGVLQIGFLTFLGVVGLIYAFYIFYFWINRFQARRRSLNFLYSKHSVIYFTNRLSENDGVITDYCVEARSQSSFKKTEIEKIFVTKNAILVKLYAGKMISFPNQKDILDLLKK